MIVGLFNAQVIEVFFPALAVLYGEVHRTAAAFHLNQHFVVLDNLNRADLVDRQHADVQLDCFPGRDHDFFTHVMTADLQRGQNPGAAGSVSETVVDRVPDVFAGQRRNESA